MSTRRSFVKLGAISGAAAFVPKGLGAGPHPVRARGASPSGTRGRFASQLDETFLVESGSGMRVPLVLVAVSDPAVLGSPGLEGHPECFSAAFLGPDETLLRQGTYAVSSRGLGRLALFLVPTGRPGAGVQRYEAAFNCVVPA